MKNEIVIFTNFYKPGYLAGGPIQSIYNLCNLLSGIFSINIITRNYDFKSRKTPYKLEKNKWIEQENGVKVNYLSHFSYIYLSVVELFRIKPSIIYINSFFSPASQINLFASKIYNLFYNCDIIIAPRGEFDEGALGIKSAKKKLFLFSFKMFYGTKIKFHATTNIEKQFILKQFKSNEIVIAENIPKTENTLSIRNKISNESKFVFLSRISPKKNLLFCLEILEQTPITGHVDFTIVGPFEDESYWNKCVEKIKKLPKNIHCQIIGPIEHHKIEKILKENHFLFFPTLAENFGHIIYESLIFGLPILISNNTPWENGRDDNGIFAHSLSETDKFQKDFKYLHSLNQQEYNDLSQAAFSYAKNKINLEVIKQQYIQMFKNA